MMLPTTFSVLFFYLVNFSVAAASPRVPDNMMVHRRQVSSTGSVLDIVAINAQRLASGLPPLPPAGYFGPTRVPALADPPPTSSSSSVTSSLLTSSSSSLSSLLSFSSSTALSSLTSSSSSISVSSSSSSSSTPLSSSTLPSESSSASPSTSPSPTPQKISGAFIKVVKVSNSQVLGYVAPPKRGGFFLSITEDDHVERMEFSFLPTGSSFDISISSSSPYPNLGFSSSTTSLTSSPYMPLVSTNPTAPDAVASKVGNPMSGIRWEYSQSSIWSYNIQTGELKAIWVNPDKSSPPTMFWYNTGFKAITIVPSPPGSDQGYELRLLVEKS